jgi:hypothetical protein
MGAMRPSVEAIVMVDQAYEAYEQYAAAQKAGVKQIGGPGPEVT